MIYTVQELACVLTCDGFVFNHDRGEMEEMLTNVVHHDVHATELGPHLQTNTEDNTLKHSWLKENLVASARLLALDSQSFLNLAVLGKDFGVVDIAVTVEISEDLDGLFPTVFARQPTGGLGKEE